MTLFAFHAPRDMLTMATGRCFARIRVPRKLNLEAVFLRSEPHNEERLQRMIRCGLSQQWQFWEGELIVNPADSNTRYAFKLIVDGEQHWLSQVGLTPYPPERDVHFRYIPDYQPASWVWEQVFYQIFPERFFDGDPSNNVQKGAYRYEGKEIVIKAWDELPDRSQGPREFYGGDLEGIRQKLPYLQDLGITALYLNPIFTSASSHKYDTINYKEVDPHFGGDDALIRLRQALHEADMRLVLDAVVNHTSERHPWFDRYDEYDGTGAYQTKTSPHRNKYVFANDDPESYHGWYGVKTLPVLNFADEDLQNEVYRHPESILRYWLREPYNIDGWRFDVIHMLGEGEGAYNNHLYMKAFRQAVREENPEAYLLGEHFFEASNWLQGDQEDAAMNYYGFTLPVWAFLAGTDHRQHKISIDATQFENMLQRARARLPFEMQLSQFNLLDSHDTPRMLTLVKADIKRMKQAVTLLLTYIGVPCIYYADEIGMEGGHDPDCRRTFPWDETQWHHELRDHYQTLIALRKSMPALKYGFLHPLYAAGDLYAFARVSENSLAIVVINRGETQNLTLPLWQVNLFDEILESSLGAPKLRVRDGIAQVMVVAGSSEVYVQATKTQPS